LPWAVSDASFSELHWLASEQRRMMRLASRVLPRGFHGVYSLITAEYNKHL